MPVTASSRLSNLRAVLVALIALAAALLATAAPATAGTANAGLPGAPSDPVAGLPWGIYTGSGNNSVYPDYAAATGETKRLLGQIALRPQAFNFGAWYPDSQAQQVAEQYIANVTGGNPDVLSQVTIFRLDPWEGQACPGSWSAADQASYRSWIDNFAAGIGSSRVALVLQPDLAFSVCAPSGVPLQLVAYAARVFSALPHTTVYVDGGVHWWPLSVRQAVSMLEQAGIRYARGFSLNTTEYDGTGAELEYGATLAQALTAAGYPDKHIVINTAENGAPFLNGQYHGNIANPRVCRNAQDTICATLGIPPTADVANPRWGLSAGDRALARRYADAYLWVGRPWLDNGAYPFDMQRALGLAASSPFANVTATSASVPATAGAATTATPARQPKAKRAKTKRAKTKRAKTKRAKAKRKHAKRKHHRALRA